MRVALCFEFISNNRKFGSTIHRVFQEEGFAENAIRTIHDKKFDGSIIFGDTAFTMQAINLRNVNRIWIERAIE